MANNRVELADGTVLMDISDTTAEASDVAAGKAFYSASGVRSLGTGNYMNPVANPTANDVLVTDANGQAVDSGVSISDLGTVKSVNGQTGTVVLQASDVGALPDDTDIPANTSDLTNDSGFITGMVILSYGNSNWQDFIEAYTAQKVVYCRASSNSNPASGSQTRLAFMAYVNNAAATSITEVEFQYYRSVSSHTVTQQGDQVYVYKLNKNNGWSVIVRENYTRITAGTNLEQSYKNGVLTLGLSSEVTDEISDLNGAINDEIAERQTYVRPNLLDNWLFLGGGSQAGAGKFPINQRGQTTYTSGWTIDRWVFINNATVEITSAGLVWKPSGASNRYFGQRMEDMSAFQGKMISVSVFIAANTFTNACYYGFGGAADTIPAGQTGLFTHTETLNVGSSPTQNCFYFRSSPSVAESGTLTIVAVKMELGDTQTLAHQVNGSWVLNEKPNYQEELVKCMGSHAESGDTCANMDYTNVLTYKVGDTIDVYDLQVSLSNSAGIFSEINLPTPKKVPNGVTLGLATTNHWMRKLSDGADVSGYSITPLRQTDHWITLRFEMPSATLGARIPYVMHYQGSVVIA
jgi:hypothetical protein